MNDFYVYQLRREDSKHPFYIGKGRGNRLNHHLMPHSLKYVNWKNGAIKHALSEGINILAEKVEDGLDEATAFELEEHLIIFYGRLDIGTGILANMSYGGDGVAKGRIVSEETRCKIRAQLKGKPLSEETKLKMKLARDGRKLSQSHKEAIRNGMKGIPRPKAACIHCAAVMHPSHISRYHNDKCKHRT